MAIVRVLRIKMFSYKKAFMAMIMWISVLNVFVNVRRKAVTSWSLETNSISEQKNSWKVQKGWRKIYAEEVHVFSAYYDRRRGKNSFGLVQVMAFQPNSYNATLYCFYVYEEESICVKSPAKRTTVFEDHRYYRTTMYSCFMPRSEIPKAVGLTRDKNCADQTNNQSLTQVVFEKWSPMKDFGVCVHSPLFNMEKHELVAEYVEMNRILGAKWFTFYIHSISRMVRKLLESYKRDGVLELVDHWSDGLPSSVVHYKGQDLNIQDCLYRNMYKVKYLVYTDLDELIFPKKHPNWRKMMNELEKIQLRTGCFLFRPIAAFRNTKNITVARSLRQKYGNCNPGDVIRMLKIPRVLSFTQRSVRIVPRRQKMIVKPLDVWTIRVHNVNDKAFYGQRRRKLVDVNMAVIYHYRRGGLEEYMNGSVYFDDAQKLAPKLFGQLKKRLCKLK